MPASALLKFVQGATVGGDGRALVGVLGTSVSLSNVNNASVQSWQIDLVYSDPTSAIPITIPYAFNNSNSTPAASFTPDVRRSYRWVLKVWSVPNRAGVPDSTDIRVFSVLESNGVLIPPSQVWPMPLPDPLSGELNAKPNEMNFNGQLFGWHGTGVDGLLNQVLAKHIPPAPTLTNDLLTVVGGRWVGVTPTFARGPGVAVNNAIALWDGTTGTLLKDSGITISSFIRADGTVSYTADQPMNSHKFTGLVAGSATGHSVEYDQMNTAIATAVEPKIPLVTVSTSTLTLQRALHAGKYLRFTHASGCVVTLNTNEFQAEEWVILRATQAAAVTFTGSLAPTPPTSKTAISAEAGATMSLYFPTATTADIAGHLADA